jgi:hypothetical protein
MRINEIIVESTTHQNQSKIGDAVRIWTSDAIHRGTPKVQAKQVAAARLLASVPGQRFPNFAYRAFGIDINKVTSWSKFLNKVESNYPESYSNSIRGVKNFLKNSGVNQIGVVIGIHLSPEDFMFDIKSIAKQLPPEQLKIPDSAGFSIKEYLPQDEVVLKPGILKKALMSGNAYLVGYEVPGTHNFKWLPKPRQINPNS